MERKSASHIICGFVLITFLYFIPSCQASRKLADFPPQNSPVGEEHDVPSASGGHGSVSEHGGSATGGTPPTDKFNTPPYPTSYPTNNNRGSYSNQNNGYAEEYLYQPPETEATYSWYLPPGLEKGDPGHP